MDKNRIKGKMDEVAGRAKRQVGEWTGDTKSQGEGALDEIKGRAENAWGKVKDGARNIGNDAKRDMNREDHDIETDRKRDVASARDHQKALMMIMSVFSFFDSRYTRLAELRNCERTIAIREEQLLSPCIP